MIDMISPHLLFSRLKILPRQVVSGQVDQVVGAQVGLRQHLHHLRLVLQRHLVSFFNSSETQRAHLVFKTQHKWHDMVVVLKKLLEHVLIAENVRPTPCTFCFVQPHKHRNL